MNDIKVDRLVGILTTLISKEKVTARQLAEQFEVSRRTIHRDIEALSCAGIPVYCVQGGDGGIFLSEGFKLDTHLLTHGMLQLHVGNGVYIDLASHYRASLNDKMATLKAGIHDRHIVGFDYYSERGKTFRRVEPYTIAYKWSSWYLYAYCVQREDFRLFKLNRMWNVCAEDEGFAAREVPADHIEKAGLFSDEKTLTLRIDPRLEYLIVEEHGPDSYAVAEDGWLQLTLTYTQPDYILRWILSFGKHAVVIYPPELIAALGEHAREMLRVYDSQTQESGSI